jgi:cell division protein DivIC
MTSFWKIIWPYLKNKYVITLVAFIIWISFFSQYNLTDRVKLTRNFKDLQQEKEYYLDQVRRDSARLHELTTDEDNLEKFAREQYYMKKPKEDIFVVVEE